MKHIFSGAIAIALAAQAGSALADPTANVAPVDTSSAMQAVQPLKGTDAYRAIFAALRASNWPEVKTRALMLGASDPVRALALSELYTAKGSPKVELFDLLDLLNRASWLPNADQLGRMAKTRGAELIPDGPQVRKLMWIGGSTKRRTLAPTREDIAAQALTQQILPYIKADDPSGAESLLAGGEPGLSPDGLAEVRQRIAWSYYIENDDANARRLAARALETGSGNEWAVDAHWPVGLASWRQNDPAAAARSFEQVARRATTDDMRSAGAYWAARAWMNAGQPAKVEPLLKTAAGRDETFYGMLARETLGMAGPRPSQSANPVAISRLTDQPAVRAALAMQDIGELGVADELLRRQAEIGNARDYDALLGLTESLNLPATQLWLAHRSPAGHRPDSFARFPRPTWQPQGGWRVDPALVFAHALQESSFRPDIVSPAGARGLMQVMPGTARLVAGQSVGTDQLAIPSVNMEYGQRYLEQLSRMSATGGLLPKIMAAYNAGPTPVERWNSEVRDGGDPLLFMESLPYYETRAYVNIVMRNYWMYQLRQDGRAEALTAMTQGKWPAFPVMKGGKVAQVSYRMIR